jgi:basic membrane lipoprotein Med (substrate-binding protein (PBP1-ABC) superfamily)
VITHTCGLGECPTESSLLAEEIQSPACNSSYAHKVTLVLDGGNIDDGTFNQLAYEGAMSTCTSAISCCLEVDRVDGDVENAAIQFFCELEYAAADSDLSVGVGFLHEQAVHRAATCVPTRDFAIVDVAYFGANAGTPNLEGLTFADDQAGYLAGVIAGHVSAGMTQRIGVVGGLQIVPVLRFINGFINGVSYACPSCVVTAIYCPFGPGAEPMTNLTCAGDFADAAFGVGVAQYLIAQGVDVIFGAGGLTGSAGIKYASAPQGTSVSIMGATSFSGVKSEASAPYVVGVDKDEWYTTFGNGSWAGASKLITSALKRVDVGVSLSIQNYLANTHGGRNFMLDASNGGVGIAPPHLASVVTPAITASALMVFDAMAAGTWLTRIEVCMLAMSACACVSA